MTPINIVEQTLRAHVIHDPNYKASREKTSQLTVLGLRLPVMYAIEKKEFPFYKDFDSTLIRWDKIWKRSTIHEAMTLALMYAGRHINKLDLKHWKLLQGWIDRVENWEHADSLCWIYSMMYERYPKAIEPTLFKWNKSKSPWKRRCSIVSTIYYASKKRTPPKRATVFKLLEPLLSDTDEYVRKGVGWQLREAYNLWPKEALAFIEKHLTSLSATTFSYATEKIPTKKKARLKAFRKASRLAKK